MAALPAQAGAPVWLLGQPGAWILCVHVQPGARRTQLVGEHNGALKLRIAAPALQGRANAELIRFFAEQLGVTLRAVSLIGGAGSRGKRVRIETELDAQTLALRLHAPVN